MTSASQVERNATKLNLNWWQITKSEDKTKRQSTKLEKKITHTEQLWCMLLYYVSHLPMSDESAHGTHSILFRTSQAPAPPVYPYVQNRRPRTHLGAEEETRGVGEFAADDNGGLGTATESPRERFSGRTPEEQQIQGPVLTKLTRDGDSSPEQSTIIILAAVVSAGGLHRVALQIDRGRILLL